MKVIMHEPIIPNEFTNSSSVTIHRKANEGFINYNQSTHVVHENEQPVFGCFAFVHQIVEDALSYSNSYELKSTLTERINHQKHTLVLPCDFPVIARNMEDIRMYFDKEFDAFTFFSEENTWFDTTIGYVYERWIYIQQEMYDFKKNNHIDLHKEPFHFRDYRWLEVIVNAELLNQSLITV